MTGPVTVPEKRYNGRLGDLTWRYDRAELDRQLGLDGLDLLEAGQRQEDGSYKTSYLQLAADLINKYHDQGDYQNIDIAGLTVSYGFNSLYFKYPGDDIFHWFNAEAALCVTNGTETVTFATTITFDDYLFENTPVFKNLSMQYYIWLLHVSSRVRMAIYAPSQACLDKFITILATGL